MAYLMTKFSELVHVAAPVLAGVLLWSYLAAAVVYGTLSV